MDNRSKVLDFPRMTGSSSSSRGKAIPRYVLYGEHEGLPGLEPLHVETIRARSDPNDWRIHPHRHAELHQFMRVSQGGGRMMAEGRETGFTAPCLLYVPPGAVHGFNWIPDSDGHVMMAADGLVAIYEPALLNDNDTVGTELLERVLSGLRRL
jgi:mannose-6-phosphate isomerase-like protein (cupin superfamily)